MWTKPRSLLLSRIIILLFLVLLVAGSVSLPALLRLYFGYMGNSLINLTPLMSVLWACAIPAFAALIQLGRMLKNISSDRVFVKENVGALRLISWCCFLVSIVFFCFTFYYVL